jgi:hypothetical protein
MIGTGKLRGTHPRRCRLLVVCCLVGFAACGSSSSGVVGAWGDPNGRSMVFDAEGRVTIRDPKAATLTGTYTYSSGLGEVKITLTEDGRTMQGKLLTPSRLQIGTSGRPFIFNRRGSR